MYEMLKERTVPITVMLEGAEEVVCETAVDDDSADLASLRWYEGLDEDGDTDVYTIVDLLGTKIHVRLNDVLFARHRSVAVVTGGVRPGGKCPNAKRASNDVTEAGEEKGCTNVRL